MARRRKAVSIERLITVTMRHYRAGSTLTSAAAELGLSGPAVSMRLRGLRKAGVKGLPEWGVSRKGKKRSLAARARAILALIGTA